MNDMINKTEILKRLRGKLNYFRKLGIKNIALFGSYANGTQTVHSDIDIFLDFEPEAETFDNFFSACNLLDNLFESYRVDVVTKNGLSKHIGPRIEKGLIYV